MPLAMMPKHAKDSFFTPAMTPVEAVNRHVITSSRLVPVDGAGRSGRGCGLDFGGEKPQHAEK